MKDAKAATELQPHLLKAFVTGKSSSSTRNQVDEEPLSGCQEVLPLIRYLFYFFVYLRVKVVCIYGTRKRLIQTLRPCGFGEGLDGVN